APVKVAVMPLSKKEPLMVLAHEVQDTIRDLGLTQYDETGGNIGKRYRRQDEIGTPHCVTIYFDSPQGRQGALPQRGSIGERRVPIAELRATLAADLA